jgi:hypothetical protein
MKTTVSKFLIVMFVTIFAANTSAEAITFQRSPLSLISFSLGNVSGSNARVIIRNKMGQIVRTKNCYTNTCNFEVNNLAVGDYSYTIINGNESSTGTFSVK